MSVSQAVANALLDRVFGGSAYTPPANLYLAASTTTPSATGTGVTEPTGNNYSRVAITNNGSNWSAAAAGLKKNAAAFTFPEATGNWGTITHVCLYDAASGGNFVCSAQLTVARAVDVGDTLRADPNELTLNL